MKTPPKNAAGALLELFLNPKGWQVPRMRKPRARREYNPLINRWTGLNHEHKREIARRQRQLGLS